MNNLPPQNVRTFYGEPQLDESVASIAWTEGMQLLPQHFQYADRRFDLLLRRYSAGCFAHHWGIDHFSLDPSALASGILKIISASGQFPDGLTFGFDTHQYPALEFDFGLAGREFPLRLALAVPASDFDSQAGSIRRYRQYYGAPIADSSNVDEKASIACLQPQLSIRVWTEDARDHVLLPLIEIAAAPQGFEVTPYHPPAVRIVSQSALEKAIVEVALGLRRAAALVQGHAVPDRIPEKYTNGHGWILSCLTSGLSTLEAQIASRVAHPYDLYLTLCGIAGNVAAIKGVIPPYFQAYDHFDPAAAISAISRFILDSIPSLEPERALAREIPFERQVEPGLWIVSLPVPFENKTAVLLLTLQTGNGEFQIQDWIDKALICYSSQMAHCRELRVRGLSRRLTNSESSLGLSCHPGQHLLLVEGLQAPSPGESLVVEFVQGAAKASVNLISLVVSNG